MAAWVKVTKFVPPKGCVWSMVKYKVPAFCTITVTVAKALQPPFSTVTEYVPALAEVAFSICVFWLVELKAFGPVQVYEVPPVAESWIVAPAATGLLAVAVAVIAAGSVIVTDSEAEHPLASVTVTV